MSTKKSPTTKKAAEKPSEQIVTGEVKIEPVIPTRELTKVEKARQTILEDYGDIGLNQGFLLKAILTELVMRRI